MKSGFVLILLLYCSLALAQAPLSWGAKIGMNLSQHYGTKVDEQEYDVKTGLRPGIIAGVAVDFAANDNLSLCFEALYSMKGSKETIRIKKILIDEVLEELDRPAEMKVKYYLDYFEMPVLFKLKTLDTRYFDLQAIVGSAMSLKVKGDYELNGVIWFPEGDGEYSEVPIQADSNLSYVNMFDFSFIYGGALDLKLKIPLSLEYRFTLGWDYLNLPTYESFEAVKLRNQAWSLLLFTTF
jgi:hypothetical protein